MLEVGDLVKVTGKTLNALNEEVELIEIGTICRIVDVDKNDGTVEIISLEDEGFYSTGYYYDEKDLQKGRFEWIPESEVD